MNFVADKSLVDGKLSVCLEIPLSDMQRARFDGMDFRLMNECERSEFISDKLLALEMIARRIEDQPNE